MTRAKIFSLVCTGNGSADSATQTGSEVVASYYPKNLNISGFKIENGVAKATILDRCIEKGYKCDYNKPDTVLYTQDNEYINLGKGGQTGSAQVFVEGYSIGIYAYDYVRNGEASVVSGKFLILVGKDNKWRYDYLDCLNSDINKKCEYAFSNIINKNPKNISLYTRTHRASGLIEESLSIDAEAFLNSKKSHFVLKGY